MPRSGSLRSTSATAETGPNRARRPRSIGFSAAAALVVAAGLSIAPGEVRAGQQAAPPIEAPQIAPQLTTFTLDNGLQVVVIPDHRAPVVTHMIWYKAGAADEPAGKSGIAHFLEHLMFKGTKAHPTGEFSKVVSDIGGEENAFTSNDYTAFYQQVSKENLKQMMEFEADRMENLVLTDAILAPEKQVVLQERAQRIENDPSAELAVAMSAALYVTHPYAIPVIGWRPEIEALTAKDALAFYDKYYTPNNAVLIVAGDVTPDEVKRLAEETYGKVPRRSEPGERVRPPVPELQAERRVTLSDERVSQPVVQQAWLVPTSTARDPKETAALAVLAEVLGGGSTSRMYDALVRNGGPATDAGAGYQSGSLDEGRFTIYVMPRDGVKPEDAETAMDGVLADLIAKGATAEEVDRAKRSIIADTIYAQDSQSSLARAFGTGLTTGETIDSIRNWPKGIAAVTPAEVQAVAQRYLGKSPAATGVLLPKPGGKGGGAPVSPLTSINQQG